MMNVMAQGYLQVESDCAWLRSGGRLREESRGDAVGEVQAGEREEGWLVVRVGLDADRADGGTTRLNVRRVGLVVNGWDSVRNRETCGKIWGDTWRSRAHRLGVPKVAIKQRLHGAVAVLMMWGLPAVQMLMVNSHLPRRSQRRGGDELCERVVRRGERGACGEEE